MHLLLVIVLVLHMVSLVDVKYAIDFEGLRGAETEII